MRRRGAEKLVLESGMSRRDPGEELLGIRLAIVAILAPVVCSRAGTCATGLPERASDILFVGDSVTAGMYFFSHAPAPGTTGTERDARPRSGARRGEMSRQRFPLPTNELVSVARSATIAQQSPDRGERVRDRNVQSRPLADRL